MSATGCLGGPRPAAVLQPAPAPSTTTDFDRDVTAARERAVYDTIDRGFCFHHQVVRCPSNDAYTAIHSSDGFVWSSTAYDREGRRIFEEGGGCLGRGPTRGVEPRCREKEATLRDLCVEALEELHVGGGSLSCGDAPQLCWDFTAPGGTVEGPGFSLRVVVRPRASEGVSVSLLSAEPGLEIHRCPPRNGECSERLLPGDELHGPIRITRAGSSQRCQLRLRYARGPCASCEAPAVTTTKP